MIYLHGPNPKKEKEKRDLRIVFTGSCADLLRHGLLMLMFLDGTYQASELDGSSTLILFMMLMVILTTPWELRSRSTPKKFVLHSSRCAPHRFQTFKRWNLIKSCKKLAIAADAATSWPNWGRLLERAHNPPGIMAVLRVDDRGSQLSNTPFSYIYIYIHGYQEKQLPNLLIHNPGTQFFWEKSNNHAGSIMKPSGSLMLLK